MRKLKIIRSQHKNDERQRRVNLNSLRQTSKSLSPRFEWVIPYGTPAVQTIFNQSQPVAGGVELVLDHARPALLKRQAIAGVGYDAPGERIGVNQNLIHRDTARSLSRSYFDSLGRILQKHALLIA